MLGGRFVATPGEKKVEKSGTQNSVKMNFVLLLWHYNHENKYNRDIANFWQVDWIKVHLIVLDKNPKCFWYPCSLCTKNLSKKEKQPLGILSILSIYFTKKCTFLWILKGFFYSFIFVINYFELKLAQSAKNSRF